MGENMENNRPRYGVSERILVIVNKDWFRTYMAFVSIFKDADGRKKYTATCKLKDSTIVGIADSNDEMSDRMDELATIIEEYTSPKLPTGVKLSKDLHCALN